MKQLFTLPSGAHTIGGWLAFMQDNKAVKLHMDIVEEVRKLNEANTLASNIDEVMSLRAQAVARLKSTTSTLDTASDDAGRMTRAAIERENKERAKLATKERDLVARETRLTAAQNQHTFNVDEKETILAEREVEAAELKTQAEALNEKATALAEKYQAKLKILEGRMTRAKA
jgi:uncharacterized protein YhaN